MRRLLFIVLALLLAVEAPRPASAGDSAFEVTERVDGAGQSATEAYTKAVNGGRRQAWELLVHKLTTQEQWAKLTAADDLTLQRMVKTYKAANERRSTTRYSADVTYIFNEPLVRNYFRTSGVAFSAAAAAPMLVVPMAPGYAPDSPWGRAWAGIHMAAGLLPVTVPDADPLNRAALASLRFETAAWSDLAPAASRVRAAQAAVVQAGLPRAGHLFVGVRILSFGQPPLALTPIDVPVPAKATPEQTYGIAAKAAAEALGEAWKSRNAIDFSKRATLDVAVAIDSLNMWGQIEQRLIKVPVVMNIRVNAMAIGQVRATVTYAGTQPQLLEQLGPAGFGLMARDGETWLIAGPPPPAAP